MKVRFWCCTHDFQSKVEEIIEVDDNTSEEDLDDMAKDYFWNEKEPEWGFERID